MSNLIKAELRKILTTKMWWALLIPAVALALGWAWLSALFFTNIATSFHFSYERYLVNKIREAFGFDGSPIRIQVRRRAEHRGSGSRVAQAARAPREGGRE